MSKLVHPRQPDAPAEATRSGIVPRGVRPTSRPPHPASEPLPPGQLVEVPAWVPAPTSRRPALPPPARGAGASTLPPPYHVAQHAGSLRPAPAPSIGRPVPRHSSAPADRRAAFAPVTAQVVAESGSHPAAASGSYPAGPSPSSLPPPVPSWAPSASASGFFAPTAAEPFATVDTWRPPRSRRLALLAAVVASVAAVVLLAVALLSPPAPGVLHVTTAPADATLYVDGRVVDGKSPFVLTELETGVAHAVEVRADGYRGWRAELTVEPGSELVLPLVELLPLEELPVVPPVPLAAPAAVPAAEPAVAPEATHVGSQHSRVARPAAVAPTRPSAQAQATRPTAAAEPASGILRLNSRPWSQVWIDGEHVGHTPLTSLSLPAGRHQVRLENEGFELEKQVTLSIAAGETLTEIVNLAE